MAINLRGHVKQSYHMWNSRHKHFSTPMCRFALGLNGPIGILRNDVVHLGICDLKAGNEGVPMLYVSARPHMDNRQMIFLSH